jgi:DNA polymerase-3 subunit delta
VTPDDLQAELDSENVRPAYLLAGEEALLRDDALAALRKGILGDGLDDFNLVRLPGDATSPSALNDALAELPVMAKYRLVILTDPDGKRAGAKALTDALGDAVAEHVARSKERVDSVLIIAASKPDKRQRWVKAFGKEPAAIVACDSPKGGREVVKFLKSEAKLQDVNFEKGAAERLADLIGPQLLLLRQEVAKAALVAGPGQAITRAHIEASTSQLAEEPIWDLTDAIGEGRTKDAIALLGRMSDAPAPVVLGALASHFRKLTRVRHGGGVPGPPFVTRKLENQARRFSPARLRACMTAIHECDLAIKGASPLPPQLTLERLVLGLAL